MAAYENNRYFNARAAIIAAVAAAILAFPALYQDLFRPLGPREVVATRTLTSYSPVAYSPLILPPLLTSLIELEHQKRGVDGVTALMKQLESPVYKDVVYSYLITMLIGQNSDIHGIETYHPNPLGVPATPVLPIEPRPSATIPSAPVAVDRNGVIHATSVAFVQKPDEVVKSPPPATTPKTDNERLARAGDLATQIQDMSQRIYMLVEVAKARAEMDHTPASDDAPRLEAIKFASGRHHL